VHAGRWQSSVGPLQSPSSVQATQVPAPSQTPSWLPMKVLQGSCCGFGGLEGTPPVHAATAQSEIATGTSVSST
jgi:hypothetical protein